jgi:hypothetical protein
MIKNYEAPHYVIFSIPCYPLGPNVLVTRSQVVHTKLRDQIIFAEMQ